jgi:hypothetical protein
MPDNSARLPAQLRAGDTLDQRIALADYPASPPAPTAMSSLLP